MVSLINLGNFTIDASGRATSDLGVASGIDTKAIIEALDKSRRQPAVDLQTQQTKNTSTITALSTLRTKLNALMNSVNILRNPPGVGNDVLNIFKARQAFVTSNSTVPGTTYLGVTTESGADLSSYDITVDQLAKNKIQRTNAFTSNTTSVTDAAATNNANRFSAGTFQISGGQVQTQLGTATSDTLLTADYTSTGTVGSSVLDNTFGAGGIANIAVASAAGDTGLLNSLSKAVVVGAQVGGAGADVSLTLTLNGRTYTSNAITANTGGGGNEIAANTTITFTNSDTGTSFQVRTGAAQVIDSESALSSFAVGIDEDLTSITVYQRRTLDVFTASEVAGTTLAGLTIGNVTLTSNNFNLNSGSHGIITNFVVTGVSAPAAADATITLTIDGETYQATGLGTAGADTHTANIVLTNTNDSNKTFNLNINDAAITLNFSTTTTAKTIQKDLNTIFGTGVNITLEQGDTLQDIATKINSQNNISRVTASVIKVADNDYRLTIQSDDTGTKNAYVLNDVVDDVFTSTVTLNLVGGGAADSILTINGVAVTRSSNEISDVVDKVTFNLFQETPALTLLKIDISNDIASVSGAFENFVAAYNDFKTFATSQQLRDPSSGAYVSTALLGQSSTLNLTLSALSNSLTSTVSGLPAGSLRSLQEIGLAFTDIVGTPNTAGEGEPDNSTPDVANALLFNAAAFQNIFNANSEIIEKISGVQFNSTDNSKLALFQTSNKMQLTKFTVDIDISRPAGQQAQIKYDDGAGGTITVNADFTQNSTGGLITGPEGSVIDGLKLIYVGNGTDVIANNTYTQGVMDKLYNILNSVTKTSASLDSEVNTLVADSQDKERRIATINFQADQKLLIDREKFKNLELAVAKANQLLQLLDAQDAARRQAAG